jgi:transposase
MPKRTRVVIGGVDTHGRTHHAAAIDQQGRLLGDREFPLTVAATDNWLAGCAATGTWTWSGSKALAATAPA